MNDKQRKELEQVQQAIIKCISIVEGVKDENQDSYDNMPEGLQNGEKGEQMNEAIDNLSSAIDSLGEVESYIESAIGG